MEPIELRDLDAARRFVAEGLWLQRAVKPNPATVKSTLEWAMEIAASGQPLPPVGFIGDLGHIALGADSDHRPKEALHIPGWPPTLVRMYEDHVLGKLYADATFERAGDALKKYSEKDRIKGIAYIVNQMQARANIPGVYLSPAVIRGLRDSNHEEVLASAMERMLSAGPSPLLVTLYEQLVAAARRMNESLVREDITALEDRSALGDMGQYVALLQIHRAKAALVEELPALCVRPLPNRREVPTRVLDEDQYPVGGYTSISTKCSIESLLHSQLAYIEERDDEPDLFDVKFTRNELFYYSRDENQFLRRRRAFVFVLSPDLIALKYHPHVLVPDMSDKDKNIQRIVMLMATILALVEKLTDWLSTDAIHFEVLFVQDGEKKPLAEASLLMKLLLRERIERGDATIEHVASSQKALERIQILSQQAQVHALIAATEPVEVELDHAVTTQVIVDGPRPQLGDGASMVYTLDGENAFEVWQATVLRVLELWV